MKAGESIVVVHKTTGLDYRLTARADGSFYLSANDGVVPSGQVLNGPLETILSDFQLKRKYGHG